MSRGTSTYFNRELSWLEFNQRVLNEALDERVPLLERLNFLAITATNLDEFFMVRVGSLELLAAQGERRRDPAGLTPQQQLEAVGERVRAMVADQYACVRQHLESGLSAAGIRLLAASQLSDSQRRHLERVFNEEVFPLITPMAMEAGERLPSLANLRLHVAVRLASETGRRGSRLAVIPLAPDMRRVLAVPAAEGRAFILVDEVVKLFIDRFFPGKRVVECVMFRLTRNADLIAREDFAADFLDEMEDVLSRRKESDVVRLEVEDAVTRTLLSLLERVLPAAPRTVYRVPGLLDLAALRGLTALPGLETLRYDPWPPQPSPDAPPEQSLFELLARRELLLLHPYEAYDPVLRLVEEAADDPDVLAIKQILYRTSARSPILAALHRAAEAGKHVTVLVELKARFDEARNILWARDLERAGAQVIYGVKGFKAHAKVLIVVRREAQGLARYVHFGTGNYNERTARLYSDVSFMTRDPDLAADASAFFNAISGYSEPPRYLKLAQSPRGIRDRLLELIRGETERSRQGQKGLIMAKMNSLVDPDIIEALYKASKAGVTVRLNVRGICCLRPGVKGLSERIEVVSIIDRYLEHGRVFYFHQGGDPRVFLASADWMPRNLDRRVELMVPIEAPAFRRRITGWLKTWFRDNTQASRLQPDGAYERLRPAPGQRAVRSQEALYREACQAAREEALSRRTVFEPLLPAERALPR